MWKVCFVEESKEEKRYVLKTMCLRNRAGSVQIKLNVPAPEIDKVNMDNLVKYGGYAGIVCSLNDKILHEVRYYFEICHVDESELPSEQLKHLRVYYPSTTSFMQVDMNEPELRYIRKLIKKSEIETPNNFTLESEIKAKNTYEPLDPVLLEDSGYSESIEFYKPLTKGAKRKF